ncbi:MAG: hypothetical protein AAF790_14055 [Planctomycetota bacterium]
MAGAQNDSQRQFHLLSFGLADAAGDQRRGDLWRSLNRHVAIRVRVGSGLGIAFSNCQPIGERLQQIGPEVDWIGARVVVSQVDPLECCGVCLPAIEAAEELAVLLEQIACLSGPAVDHLGEDLLANLPFGDQRGQVFVVGRGQVFVVFESVRVFDGHCGGAVGGVVAAAVRLATRPKLPLIGRCRLRAANPQPGVPCRPTTRGPAGRVAKNCGLGLRVAWPRALVEFGDRPGRTMIAAVRPRGHAGRGLM